MIPQKNSYTNNRHPWISTRIKRLSRQKKRWYNKAKLSHSTHDWSQYYSLKKECHRECQIAYNTYINSFIDTNDGQVSKKLWSFIKSKRKDQCSIPPISHHGNTITDSFLKSNTFNEYFTSIFTQVDISSLPSMEDSPFSQISSVHNQK